MDNQKVLQDVTKEIELASSQEELQIVKVTYLGKMVENVWKQLGIKYEIDININGIDALPNFYIHSNKCLKYKTLISQEMLKYNFLWSNAVYLSTAHNEKVLNKYQISLGKVLSYKYLNNFIDIANNELGLVSKKILHGFNENEVIFTHKRSKNLSFFEKFFNFFN